MGTAQLNALPRFHLPPSYRVLFPGPYQLNTVGVLILGRASRLDAFSAYRFLA